MSTFTSFDIRINYHGHQHEQIPLLEDIARLSSFNQAKSNKCIILMERKIAADKQFIV